MCHSVKVDSTPHESRIYVQEFNSLALQPHDFFRRVVVTSSLVIQWHSHWGGGRGPCSPPLQFPNQNWYNSFSFKLQKYCFLRLFRNYTDQKVHDFYCVCYNLTQLFFFINYKGKRSFHVGLSEKVRYLSLELIVDQPKEDHNEKKVKRYIIGGILDQKKSCK